MPNTLDPNSAVPTILQDSVNIVLSTLGEAPVNSLTGTTASLALNIIEEVSNDIQSKGWWFNQQTGGNFSSSANIIIYPSNTSSDWHANIPEEARRYITIRAARIAHTRLIGTEENFKFSFQEEQVSLAILQQAHVRNSNGDLSFSSYPSDLKNLGIDEYIFIQGNLEEKLRTIGLASELSNRAKTVAETALLGRQSNNVYADTTLKGAQATDVAADTTLKGKQGSLVDAQRLDVNKDTEVKGKQKGLIAAQTTDVAADTTLKGKQGSLVDVQATDVAADTTLKGKQGNLVDAQATDVAADTTLKGKQGSLVDTQALDVAADTTLKGKQGSLVDVQALDVVKDTEVKGKQKELVSAQKALLDSQKTELDVKTLIGATAESTFMTQVLSGASASYVDYAPEFRIMGIQEIAFQEMPAYKKYELLHDAQTMKTARGLNVVPTGQLLTSLNNVLGLIGEPRLQSPNLNLTHSSIASEAYSLLYQTDRELQSRGWWFNTEDNVEFTANHQGQISLASFATLLSVELNDIPHTTIFLDDGSNVRLLKDLNKNSTTSFSGTEKGRVIFLRDIAVNEVPEKYRQYLEVRVAMILTELYPQSGIDVQRLPKMEAELETYFKDREAEEGNYSVFDNYDASVRVGVNRSYNLF